MDWVIINDEETESITESTTESSGEMTLDGDAWKERNDTTYSSLLDIYGASDLFSEESSDLYYKLSEKNSELNDDLIDYVCSGNVQSESNDDELKEWIFSEQIVLSKNKTYDTDKEDYLICFVLAGILVLLVFISALIRTNHSRKKRREKYATEIDI